MFRDNVQFSRERLEFWYSIGVLVAIPILMVANTLLMATSVRKNFDQELSKKADLVNGLIATAIADDVQSPTKVQAQIVQFAEGNDDLEAIEVAVPRDNSAFTVIAATDVERVDEITKSTQYVVSVDRNRSVAQELVQDDGSRTMRVVSPITVGNEIIGVIQSDVSLRSADALIGNTLLRSIVIVGATVVVIVLLLLNHFKFVEYALLFRKLKEVDQLKSDFLSVASHELKAPMTVIKGNIENLIDGLTGSVDEKAKESLRGMFAETERLNGLVSDLLNVSRIEQGRISYDMTVVDARLVVEDVVGRFKENAAVKGLVLEHKKTDKPVWIHVDKGRLIEIMTNLTDNAIKYSAKGTITIDYKISAKSVHISVRDTGIGMSAEDRERLFDRFYRVKNDKTKDIPGTGLGLWIIKQYIQHMQGKITVDSLQGEGSEFVVSFPIASAPKDKIENNLA